MEPLFTWSTIQTCNIPQEFEVDIYATNSKHADSGNGLRFLHKYEFEIIYHPGKESVIADSLSRKSFVGSISILENPIP